MRKLVILSLMLLMASCAVSQTTENPEVAPQKQEINRSVFGDIPIYPGFKLIYDKSFTYQSGDIKVGKLVFSGKAKLMDVVDFYKKSLPELGWELVSAFTYEKSAFMDFLSEDRSLQINVKKEFSGLKLTIQIGPRSH